MHGNQALYFRTGYNLAKPLVACLRPITDENQWIIAAAAPVLATNQATNASSTSRVGSVTTSSIGGVQSLRMVFLVDEPGADIYMAHPVFDNGDSNIALMLDGYVVRAGFSMNNTAFTAGTGFVQDFETCIAENIDPGLHILHMTTAATKGAGIHYLRTRKAMYSAQIAKSNAAIPVYRKLLAQAIESQGSIADTTFLIDELPSPRLLRDLEFEFVATLQKDSGFVVHGLSYGTNGGAATARQGVIIAINGAGALCVYEATGPANFASTVLYSGIDHSLTSHTYRVVMTSAGFGTCQVFVDGISRGTATLTMPWWGGSFGLWKSTAGGNLRIDSLHQIIRL